MGPAAGPLSLHGAGLSAAGAFAKGAATAYGDEYQAQRLEKAAQVGRVKASETAGQMTERINDVLGNIDAVRAAAHDDPTSPTGAAIRQTAEDRGTRAKAITINNIMEQVQQDETDAKYERDAARWALFGGEIGAGASLASGLGSFFSKMPGGGG